MMRICSLVIVAGLALSGCSTSEVKLAHAVHLVPPTEVVPENQLLDIGIRVFNPGVPDGEIDKDLEEELLQEGTFVQIRRTEAMYMAVELRETLQRSGHWGTVWVTPTVSTAADLNIVSEILHSDGDIVELRVTATDASGRVWIDDVYEHETTAGAFNRQRYPDLDPYQDVFNTVANDLAAVRAELDAEDIEDVRTVAQLRYAGELSPESFADYVEPNRNGVFQTVRLPANDDPMFTRTLNVRQREQVFFETLDQHYENFSVQAATSYIGWREYSREEAIAIRELTRSTRLRTGLGIATIIASVVYGQQSDNSFSDRVVRDAMMYVGADMLQSSQVRRQERRLHTATLEELAEGFDDAVAPLVVEIQGTQHRLTGTAEVQYTEWRDLLQQLFISETGFVPENIDVYSEPIDESAVESAVAEPPAEEAGAEVQEVITDASGGPASGV